MLPAPISISQICHVVFFVSFCYIDFFLFSHVCLKYCLSFFLSVFIYIYIYIYILYICLSLSYVDHPILNVGQGEARVNTQSPPHAFHQGSLKGWASWLAKSWFLDVSLCWLSILVQGTTIKLIPKMDLIRKEDHGSLLGLYSMGCSITSTSCVPSRRLLRV